MTKDKKPESEPVFRRTRAWLVMAAIAGGFTLAATPAMASSLPTAQSTAAHHPCGGHGHRHGHGQKQGQKQGQSQKQSVYQSNHQYQNVKVVNVVEREHYWYHRSLLEALIG